MMAANHVVSHWLPWQMASSPWPKKKWTIVPTRMMGIITMTTTTTTTWLVFWSHAGCHRVRSMGDLSFRRRVILLMRIIKRHKWNIQMRMPIGLETCHNFGNWCNECTWMVFWPVPACHDKPSLFPLTNSTHPSHNSNSNRKKTNETWQSWRIRWRISASWLTPVPSLQFAWPSLLLLLPMHPHKTKKRKPMCVEWEWLYSNTTAPKYNLNS
mmetsp:Transcript_8795/g.15952  ORF Transcript_8795/g.15952 Transcript_8795/m.15952 type:complete len:212 (-) Transcript_8795:759-1394(-)